MEDVANNVILEFSDTKRTTMGTAWTHYGPNNHHQTHYRQGKQRIKNPLFALNGKGRGGIIIFATKLFERASQKDREETIIHEVAHILADLKAKRNAGHGPAWMRMMVRLGCEPKRCHKVDTQGLKRRQKRYQLRCSCGWACPVSASHRTKAANTIQSGEKAYWCPKCQRLDEEVVGKAQKEEGEMLGQTFQKEKKGRNRYRRIIYRSYFAASDFRNAEEVK
jgi:predicted SprT family Zn-dependent metalloprotease